MSKNSRFAVVGAVHRGAWHADKRAAPTACAPAAPTGLHYKIAHGFLKAGIHDPISIRLAEFDPCARAVSAIPGLVIHDIDMIPEAAAKGCLSAPIFAQITETDVRPISAAALCAT